MSRTPCAARGRGHGVADRRSAGVEHSVLAHVDASRHGSIRARRTFHVHTKMALPRRTFLRGIGATLALPLLDAMVPALTALAQTPARPVRRLGFIYGPNGVARNFAGINYWTPKGEGANFELSPILTPLAPFRDRLVVVSGLAQHQADAHDDGANGDHTRGTSSWLTGVHPKRTEGADVRNGISADQIAAADARQGHGAAVAGAGHRPQFPRRPVREQLQLRVPEHAGVAHADDAAADREQSAHRVRAAVRRRRHAGAAAGAGASRTGASSIR